MFNDIHDKNPGLNNEWTEKLNALKAQMNEYLGIKESEPTKNIRNRDGKIAIDGKKVCSVCKGKISTESVGQCSVCNEVEHLQCSGAKKDEEAYKQGRKYTCMNCCFKTKAVEPYVGPSSLSLIHI